jgi:hypothetical protein
LFNSSPSSFNASSTASAFWNIFNKHLRRLTTKYPLSDKEGTILGP